MKATAAKLDASDAGVIRLLGDLTFQTVPALREPLLQALSACTDGCRLNLEGIGRVDSSALSLWLVCQREARRRGVQLTLESPPRDLCSIAEVVGLTEMLR